MIESDKDTILRLALRIKMWETQAAALTQDIDCLREDLARVRDDNTFLKDRNAALIKQRDAALAELDRIKKSS